MLRNMPENHSLYGSRVPVLGVEHKRTLDGLGGFRSTAGHFITRGWGEAGSALCGKTVQFKEDPIRPGDGHLAGCCVKRFIRISRRVNS